MGVRTTAPTGSVLLEGIRWSTFEALLEDLGPHRGRITYSDGCLEIMSPSRKHENVAYLLGSFVTILADALGLDWCIARSTTLKRQDLGKGVELDDSYYVQNAASVIGKDDIDLEVDPPPDVGIEAEVSRLFLRRMPICEAIAIPELWRSDGEYVVFAALGKDGRYEEVEESRTFPGLFSRDLVPFIAMRATKSESAIMRAFRAWAGERFGGG